MPGDILSFIGKNNSEHGVADIEADSGRGISAIVSFSEYSKAPFSRLLFRSLEVLVGVWLAERWWRVVESLWVVWRDGLGVDLDGWVGVLEWGGWSVWDWVVGNMICIKCF